MDEQIKFYLNQVALPALQVPQHIEVQNAAKPFAMNRPVPARSSAAIQVKSAIRDVQNMLYLSQLDAVKGTVVELPQPNDPFTISLNNAEILQSPTVSVGEILTNERSNLKWQFSKPDETFYEQVLDESCRVLHFDRQEHQQYAAYDALLCVPSGDGGKTVQLATCRVQQGVDKIYTFYKDNMVPLLNDVQLERQVSVMFDNLPEKYQKLGQAPQYSALALFQRLQAADVLDTVQEWYQVTDSFKRLCFTTVDGAAVTLGSTYFDPIYLKMLLRVFIANLELIEEYSELQKAGITEAFIAYESYVDEQFLQERRQQDSYYERALVRARDENFMVSQVVCVSLLYYCVRPHYVEAVSACHLASFFSVNDYEQCPHCMEYFGQTNLSYALKVYKGIFARDYTNIPVSRTFKALLPDEVREVISDKGTPFVWSPDKHTYEPGQEIFHDFSAILQARKQPQKVETMNAPEAAPVISQNDQKIMTQEFLFDDFNRDRGCYDQTIRNLQKMATAARQRIIKRYRSNKNANSINAECIRCRKFFNDIESIKKRFVNENRSNAGRKVFTGVKRERKDKETVKKSSMFQQELIKNKLDETERYIEKLIKQKPTADGMRQQKELLDRLIKDEQVNGDNGLNIEILATPRAFNGVLKHYQKIGFSWLYHMFSNGLSCLLCDQMGLGKTIQIIAYFLQISQADGRFGPFLVICPNSLLSNWIQEIKRFAPELNVWPYWGSIQQRQAIRQAWTHLCFVNQVTSKYGEQSLPLTAEERFGNRKCPLHVLITSYSLAVSDIKHLNKIPWATVVLDEGQMIKSSETKRWRTLMNISCNQKIILSGTPIQNTLTELWSLLHFALPEVFHSRENFTQWFTRDIEMAASHHIGQIKLNQEQLARLQSILQPFVLRREKKDVAQQLGEKRENTVFCKLARRQRELYEGIKRKLNFQELFNQASDDELKNIVMQLRKIVNHPQIFERNNVRMPFVLLRGECHRTFVAAEDDDKTDADAEATATKQENSIAESETTTTVVPVIKQAKIRFETQQLDDFADLIQVQYQSDRARETYIERSIRSDQNRCFDYDIPKLVFESFVDFLQDRNYQVQQFAAQFFDVGTVFESLYNMLGVSFSAVRTVVSVVYALLGNRSHLLDAYLDRTLVSKYNQGSILPFVVDFALQLQQRSASFFCRPDVPQVVSYVPLGQVYTYAPSCLGFDPLLYTSAPNYWQNRHCGVYDYCCAEPGLMRGLMPDPRHCTTALFRYTLDHLIEQSGKLNALDKLLRDLFERGQVCLIYCQMTKMMDLLEEYLFFRRYKYVRLDGSYSVTDRRAAVDKFMTDDSIFVFLLSTRAGSLGLNLTRASNVIFYEQDWNPTQDLQAQDRVHRLGQTKEVQVWKLIARNSIDEKIFERAEQKTVVQKLVLSGQDRDENGNLLSEVNRRQSQKDLLIGILNE